MTRRMIRMPEVSRLTGLSRRTIYRRMDEGTFPASVRISAGAVAWRENEIEAWLQDPMEWSEAA